jgi:SEC-C motif-containing protein
MDAHAPCPCGRLVRGNKPAAYARCCGAYLGDYAGTPAPDAESLMRSRYTAYVLGDAAYLLASWHPGTRPPAIEPEPAARWLGLEVRSHRAVDDCHAEVEFIARRRVQGRGLRLHERSRFVREGGRWFYLDGDML